MNKQNKNDRSSKYRFPLFCLTVFLVHLIIAPLTLAQALTIICNNDVPENALSKNDVENIFLGRKIQWTNDKPIHFAILKGGETHEVFLKEYIGKTESQFTMFWKKMVFSGKGGFPTAFGTPEEMMAYVAATPGAVGYAPTQAVKDTVKKVPVN